MRIPCARFARRLCTAIAVTALVAAGAVGAAIAPASAATSSLRAGRVTFSVQPASTLGPDGRPDFNISAQAGGTTFDHVAAVNYSVLPLRLQLYATDATETSGGGFGLLPEAQKPTQVGAWISLPASSATVEVPGAKGQRPGKAVIPFTLRIPPDASPGDHAGGIVLSLQTVGKNSSGQNVILDQGVGTRVLVRVAGKLTPRLVLGHLQATYHGTLNPAAPGRVSVSYVIRNAGNIDVGVDQSVRISGWAQSAAPVHPARIALLLPGASLTETAVVRNVWPQFRQKATVTTRAIPVAGLALPAPVSTTASRSLWAAPWTIIIVVVVAVGAALIWRRLRHRRARRTAKPVPAQPVDVPV
jgi:hypothetical protein